MNTMTLQRFPNVWSDGRCVTDDLADISVAGAGVFSDQS